jgi:hypothetical protein
MKQKTLEDLDELALTDIVKNFIKTTREFLLEKQKKTGK